MTLQEQLATLLSPLAPVSPLVAPQQSAAPYIVYQRIANSTNNVLSGNGNPPAENTRLQIDVYHSSYAGAQALAAAVKGAMQGWSVTNVLLMDYDLYEHDVKLFRVILEYSTWA